ncbi:FkbM family methyltransferase [Aliiroseovarius sp. F47248L]|uniref:FkbM family methyltransferase n=1 Tax=Aliiroseovarius sp. F47248L TaxID=2926420 RepID=UPI001FF51098|nr:FkbM family methyltransferase [Aliiroseovarius sp. F47248L]MCK0138766.1 FkbM family methyltransferase [Aliiroseovarius sp. F47248L]
MKENLQRAITFFTSHLRFRPVLIALQKCYHFPPVRRVARFFDPNYIRKIRPFRYQPSLAHIDWQGTRLLVDVNDHIGFQTFIRNEPFEMAVYAIAQKLDLSRGDVILDIGANIGTASIPICRERGCELAAVEASKDTAAQLLRNISLNGVKAHVDVIALSSETGDDGFLKLHLHDGNRGANSLQEDWAVSVVDNLFEWVPSQSLDDYIARSPFADRISLIKIDVEGAELDVLRSGGIFLSHNTAPILMEYRIDANEKTRAMLHQVLDDLHDSYEVHALDEDGNKQPFDRNTAYSNVFFERRKQNVTV